MFFPETKNKVENRGVFIHQIYVLLIIFLFWTVPGYSTNNNPGFENALTGWTTAGTGWSATTISTKLRTGLYGAKLTTSGVTLKKIYNTNSTVTVNDLVSKFVTFDIYVKASLANSVIKLGFYDVTDGIEILESGSSSAGTSSFTKISFTTLGQVGHVYYPVIYGSNSVAGSISIYFDDAAIYLSAYLGNDNISPEITSGLQANCVGTAISLNFSQGTDGESGIDGVLILRKNGIITDTPAVVNQVFYSSSSSTDGPTSISGWTVVYNDSLLTTFNNDPGSNGKFTYLVFMRDAAMNYSLAENTGRIFVFNLSASNYVLTANAMVDGIYLPSGCNLFIKQGIILEVKYGADIHINGTVIDSGCFLNDLEGLVTFENGSTYKYIRDGSVLYPIVNANWDDNANCNVYGIINTEPSGTGQTFGNFQWYCNAQSVDVDLDPAFSVNGNFTLTHSGAKTVWLNGDTYLKGNLVRTAGTLNYRGNSNVIFSGISQQNISIITTFHKLTIQNAAGVKMSKTITVDSVLYLNNGILDQNGYTLKISSGASISRSDGSLTANPNFLGSYNLIYNSALTTGYELTAAQTKLNNLTINCNGSIVLAKHANVNGTLILINGIVSTGIYEVRTFNSSTTAITGYCANSFINGTLNRSITSTGIYDFPVGSSTYYELISLHLNGTSGISSVRGLFNQANPGALPSNLEVNSSPILDLLNYGYWTLTPNATLTGGFYDVVCNMHGQSNGPSTAADYCVLKREDNTMPWQSLGIHINSTQSISNGTVTAARSVLSTFSDYVIGYGGFPLPVELSYFKVEKINDKKVALNWKTESEINCETFSVERSADGKNFDVINSVKGNGTTQTNHTYRCYDDDPLMGTSYYRLHEKNSDGEGSFSQLCMVTINKSVFNFYPNPVKSEMNLQLSATGDAEIKIYNLEGAMVFSEIIYAETLTTKVDLSTISAGDYIICIKQNDSIKSLKFRKE